MYMKSEYSDLTILTSKVDNMLKGSTFPNVVKLPNLLGQSQMQLSNYPSKIELTFSEYKDFKVLCVQDWGKGLIQYWKEMDSRLDFIIYSTVYKVDKLINQMLKSIIDIELIFYM